MKSLNNKLIIYDSNCKVCSSWRDVIVRFTSIPDSKIRAFKNLTAQDSLYIDPDKFKNVMALIDTNGGPTLYGAEGVAYIFASQYRLISLLLSIKPLFSMFNFFYKTQAYNRYIIATPRSKFNCDCFPDRILKYRISYIMMTLVISVLLTLAFGNSLRGFFGISTTKAATEMLLMAGSGWVVQILLAVILMKEKSLDYIGHLGSIMVVGLLILAPWMLFHATTGIQYIYLPAISVVMSSAYMLYLHVHRIKYLELSQVWTFTWFLSLQSTAFFWIYIFHIK